MLSIVIILIIVCFLMITSWLWVGGIDDMKKSHPKYKGEDLFNEDDLDGKL